KNSNEKTCHEAQRQRRASRKIVKTAKRASIPNPQSLIPNPQSPIPNP
ncbi:MAG TPA: DNA repair protein RecO, partial [Parvularcula sp.]|nr:DNA repair protein RecO [Parvularcula sp.]